jgi:outer membrane protein assembly factor BamD (BamD/ComL family)
MRKAILVFLMIIAFGFSGCSGKKAEETYETAKFEELQKNYVHARKLYQEIIEKCPRSDYAKKASERIKALEGK